MTPEMKPTQNGNWMYPVIIEVPNNDNILMHDEDAARGAELIPAVLGGHCDVGVFSQSEVIANMDGLRLLFSLVTDTLYWISWRMCRTWRMQDMRI